MERCAHAGLSKLSAIIIFACMSGMGRCEAFLHGAFSLIEKA
jgi:hypothetical protein